MRFIGRVAAVHGEASSVYNSSPLRRRRALQYCMARYLSEIGSNSVSLRVTIAGPTPLPPVHLDDAFRRALSALQCVVELRFTT